MNTGHDVRLSLDEATTHYVNISGGPLSYHYRVAEIVLHFGSTDSVGSEHTIDSVQFPVEVSRHRIFDSSLVNVKTWKFENIQG